ncbi:GGDEF domain-containing protein [Egibacter rhizosphaerae]|uniref:GGDEF domain-containing protein n=1 Tax=Egibacter rhizosphaerae TaxID=1670831 RepID=UPI001F107541|nr:GGDEF domain-containing protein [Egibacter rhizosphaerae]
MPNRRRLDDELDRLLALARRYGRPLSVALVDIDHFKRVNDELGHQVGDRALIEVVTRLSALLRQGDLLGRWGGEEFLLLAPYAKHDAALDLAERCREGIARTPFPGVGHLTVSFGVATLTGDDDARSILRRADLALYTAKREGRDRVVGMPGLTDAGELDSSPERNGR